MSKRELPPMCRPGRTVTVTLTVGQERAIRDTIVFHLSGENFAKTVRHFILDGILADWKKRL